MEVGYLWSDPETETFSVVVKRNISDPDAGWQIFRKGRYWRVKTFFSSLLRAVGYPWSLGIFQKNKSQNVNFISFWPGKKSRSGSETMSLRSHTVCQHGTASLNSLLVRVIRIRQITWDMLCGPAYALTTPYRGFLFIYIKSWLRNFFNVRNWKIVGSL